MHPPCYWHLTCKHRLVSNSNSTAVAHPTSFTFTVVQDPLGRTPSLSHPLQQSPTNSAPTSPAPVPDLLPTEQGADMWDLNHPEVRLGTCSSRDDAVSPVVFTGSTPSRLLKMPLSVLHYPPPKKSGKNK